MHPAFDVVFVRDFVDLFPECVLEVAVDLQQLQRREDLAVKVHHPDGEQGDHGRLDDKQQRVPPGELPEETELPGDGQGEEHLGKVRQEQGDDLRGDDAGLALHANPEGADQAAEEDIGDQIDAQGHAQVALAEQEAGVVVLRHEAVPYEEEHGCGDDHKDHGADEPVIVFALDLPHILTPAFVPPGPRRAFCMSGPANGHSTAFCLNSISQSVSKINNWMYV